MREVTLGGLADLFAKAKPSGRGDLPVVLRTLGVMAVSGAREGITAGISPDGVPCAPLARSRPDGSSKPLLDNGLLRASISAMVTDKELALRASHPAAALMQFGGTIRAKKGKYLSIPISKEAKRAGGASRFPRNLFFLAVKSGMKGGLLCERGGSGGLVFHYRLVAEVTVPARPYLGFSKATLDRMQKVLADHYSGSMVSLLSGASVV